MTPAQNAVYEKTYTDLISAGFAHDVAHHTAHGRASGFELPPPKANGQIADKAAASAAPDHAETIEVLRADDLTVERIVWLWRNYLARRKLHIMAGPTGVSKTTLAVAIAATLTQAGRWPDGTRAEAGDVLVWSGEDGITDTLLPRLMAHGADLARVHFVGDMTREGERRPFDPSTDMPALLLAASRISDLCLVVVDPVILAVRGDSNQNADVRRGLFPLVKLAEATGAAVIGITHFSKGTSGKSPLDRVTGSLAFAAAARVVLAVARIPEDQGGGRVVLRAKNNLGPDQGGFRFSIQGVDVAGSEAVRLVWGEPIDGSAHDILNEAERTEDPDERGKGDELATFLRDCILEGGGSMDRHSIMLAAKRCGFSERACDRARDRVGITARTQGFGKDRKSVWTLSDTHTRQISPTKSNVYIGGNGADGANDESPSPPIPPLQTPEMCTREVGGNGAATADDYRRACNGE